MSYINNPWAIAIVGGLIVTVLQSWVWPSDGSLGPPPTISIGSQAMTNSPGGVQKQEVKLEMGTLPTIFHQHLSASNSPSKGQYRHVFYVVVANPSLSFGLAIKPRSPESDVRYGVEEVREVMSGFTNGIATMDLEVTVVTDQRISEDELLLIVVPNHAVGR